MPYGLVNPKTLVESSARWEGGFDQESVACNAAIRLIDICSTTTEHILHSNTGTGSIGQYDPFAIQATVRCSTMNGLYTDWETRALMALDAATSNAVEHELWEGALTQAAGTGNMYLLDGSMTDVTPVPGTAVKPRYGLALLEGALADAGYGYRGFIHAPVSIASVLPCYHDDDDDMLITKIGNYVISGTGYSGAGPGVVPSTSSKRWIFATGPVTVRLGDVTVTAGERSQRIDTALNTISLSAERPASVVYDGCAHFGVLVDLSLDYA